VPDAAPRSFIRIWPLWQRALHWLLAAAVLLALFTHSGGATHEAAGWVALGATVLRLVLGGFGPASARFAAFVRGPRVTWRHVRQLLSGAAPRYLNHNPLGAWMVLALLLLAAAGSISGALYVTDRFWGEAWLIATHAALCWPLAVLVPLHVGGVVHTSRAHHENLVAAMWHGRKEQRPADR